MEDGAFFAVNIAIFEQGHELWPNVDDASGDGTSASVVFGRNVDHAGLVVLIDVGEITHAMTKGRSWQLR